jgi:hypothetical protein
MSRLQIHQFPTRSDNYGVLFRDDSTEATAVIDAPVVRILDGRRDIEDIFADA